MTLDICCACSAFQQRDGTLSPSLGSVDGLGSGWQTVPGGGKRVVVPLRGPAAPGGATGEDVLECAADLQPQPPPQGWQPLNSSGATTATSSVRP